MASRFDHTLKIRCIMIEPLPYMTKSQIFQNTLMTDTLESWRVE